MVARFGNKNTKTKHKVAAFSSNLHFQKQQEQDLDEGKESQKIDISFLKDPGMYEIFDRQNDLSYYGESVCLLSRLQIHWRQFKNATHPCKKLLQAFQEQQNPENFEFFVLVSGPEWRDAEKRRNSQNEVIEKNALRCFNQTEQQRVFPPSTTIMPIMYKGKTYASVRGALRDVENVSISRTTLLRQLANPLKLRMFII